MENHHIRNEENKVDRLKKSTLFFQPLAVLPILQE